MKQDNILDSLYSPSEEDAEEIESILSDEIVVPKRCVLCKSSVVCSVLPTLISLSKIRIFLSIEQCPYFQALKNEKK